LPDENYRLSDDERTKASDHVNKTALQADDPCPHCGNINTSVGEHVFRLAVGFQPIPRGYVPIVPVICSNCGHVRLFGALAMGLVPPPQSERG
jgi:hypothetical protein